MYAYLLHIYTCFPTYFSALFTVIREGYGEDIFGTKSIVADNIYEAGYFTFSASHLTVAFHTVFLVCSLSLIVLISELVHRRLLGYTKNSDL